MSNLTFFGDEKLKQKYVDLAKWHFERGNIVQGAYWANGRGCCVGCLAKTANNPHRKLEERTNVPEWLYQLADRIFEGLPEEKAKVFVVEFTDALPVGLDLCEVKKQFLIYLLAEDRKRVEETQISDELKKQILEAIRLCENYQITGKGQEAAASAASAAWSAASAAESAASAAWSAASAASAAESAAWSATKSATKSAAWSTASAAESAAWSATESAASAQSAAKSAAWSAAYERYAEKLLELLREAK